MKTKYLFIHSSDVIDESTLFVDVYVGTQLQDQRDLHFFESLAAASQDYFFHVYDLAVSNYLAEVNLSLQFDADDNRAKILHCSMSAAKLRRLLKSGLYDEWSRRFYEATRGIRRMNLSANSAYFCAVYRADQHLAMPPTL